MKTEWILIEVTDTDLKDVDGKSYIIEDSLGIGRNAATEAITFHFSFLSAELQSRYSTLSPRSLCPLRNEKLA